MAMIGILDRGLSPAAALRVVSQDLISHVAPSPSLPGIYTSMRIALEIFV
ncbi:hypothetical protein [Desulfonatronum parangueonense]